MKYITFEDGNFVIFSEGMVHADVATQMRKKPLSAGFVSITASSSKGLFVHCYGQSLSLGIRSREQDNLKIEHACLNY